MTGASIRESTCFPVHLQNRNYSDIARALELDAKFKSLGLGLVDGLVAAVAERRRVFRVLTSDRRDFGAVRVGPRFSRALELLP